MAAGIQGPRQLRAVCLQRGSGQLLSGSAGLPAAAEIAVAGASEARVLGSPLFYLHFQPALWPLKDSVDVGIHYRSSTQPRRQNVAQARQRPWQHQPTCCPGSPRGLVILCKLISGDSAYLICSSIPSNKVVTSSLY